MPNVTQSQKSNIIDARDRFQKRMVLVFQGKITAANREENHVEAQKIVRQFYQYNDAFAAPLQRGAN